MNRSEEALEAAAALSARLREARERAGLSKHRLARLSGVSRGLLTTYERGAVPGAINLFRLAPALGVSAAWLVLGEKAGEGAARP